MATITYTMPDAIAAELVDALCHRFNYQAVLPNGDPNPESRAAFAKKCGAEWMRARVLEYRRWLAEQGAVTTPPDIS